MAALDKHAGADFVICTIADRDVCNFLMLIPDDEYDPVVLMVVMERNQ